MIPDIYTEWGCSPSEPRPKCLNANGEVIDIVDDLNKREGERDQKDNTQKEVGCADGKHEVH